MDHTHVGDILITYIYNDANLFFLLLYEYLEGLRGGREIIGKLTMLRVWWSGRANILFNFFFLNVIKQMMAIGHHIIFKKKLHQKTAGENRMPSTSIFITDFPQSNSPFLRTWSSFFRKTRLLRVINFTQLKHQVCA